MDQSSCLNCGQERTGTYCSACGQKSDTRRITFRHFITHDILHGALHMEKGMLYTARQALTRPGKAALEYIAGKRVRFYNIFYFILLMIGLILLLRHYHQTLALQIDPDSVSTPSMNEAGEKINRFLTKYNKLLIFSFAPILALNSFMLFRRRKFNFSEHFILSGMLLLGVLLITAAAIAVSFLEFTLLTGDYLDHLYLLVALSIPVYITAGYIQAFKKEYTLPGFSWRMLLFFVLCSLEIFLFIILMLGIASGWSGETEIEFTL
jgi:hypothetical protein